MPRKLLLTLFVIVFICCTAGTVAASADGISGDSGSGETAVFDQPSEGAAVESDAGLPDFPADLDGLTAAEGSPDPDLQVEAGGDAGESSAQPVGDTGLDPPLNSSDEPFQDSGDSDLPQGEPALSTDPPAVEGNTDGSGDEQGQDAGEVPALTGGDGPEQESGDTIEAGLPLIDPWFYDAGGTKHEFIGVTGIQDAIDAFTASNGRGLIYVESETFNGFTVDAVPNLTGIVFNDFYPREATAPFNPHDPSTWPGINGNVIIKNMSSAFTFLGFRVNGRVEITDCTGQLNLSYLEVFGNSEGINVEGHGGNISVSNVSSSNNLNGVGAYFSNLSGNVTLTNSAFDHNSEEGLVIVSNGIVSLNGVSASNNTSGLMVGNFSRLTVNNSMFSDNLNHGLRAESARNVPVTITNTLASGNRTHGIEIITWGVVTFRDVVASGNYHRGISIENHEATAARNVTLTRVSVTGNTEGPWSRDGIYILSKGNVVLTDVSSSESDNTAGPYHGLYINNRGGTPLDWSGTGNVTIRSSRAGTSYDFSGNKKGAGILILSNGVVSVSDVNAAGNTTQGISISNQDNFVRAVNVSRCGISGNGSRGIDISSAGAVTVIDVASSSNGNDGLYINNAHGTGNVTIRSSRAGTAHDFSGNTGPGSGIYITSKGVVTVSDVNAESNSRRGILVYNHEGAARNVTLTRGTFNNNGYEGVTITSKGAVTLVDVSASGNGTTTSHHGVVIDNATGTGNVTVRSSRAGDYYEISGNKGRGIYIFSEGTVSVSNLIIEGNHQYGAYIQNYTGQPRNVTLTRVSVSGGEMNSVATGYGINILSKGNVSLTDVSSSNNKNDGSGYFHGLWVNNLFGTGSVTVRSSRSGTFHDFSNNKGHGINIVSKGVITVSDVIASNNDYNGIFINNHTADAARNVMLTRGTFNDNKTTAPGIYNAGVYILSKGAVTLTDISASNNGTDITHQGVVIDNTYGTGNVTVRSSRAGNYYEISGNLGRGLYVKSHGVVTVSNVNANNNRTPGIHIENHEGLVARAVNITRCNANDSFGIGILVRSKGNVTLVDVSSKSNGLKGVSIKNDYDDATGNVIVRSSRAASYCDFSGNGGIGLEILSNGTITVRNINAIDNVGTGIDARTAGPNKNITLQNLYTHGNGGNGIYSKLATGTVNVRNVYSYNNAGNGIWVDEGDGRVNFLNCAFIGNGGNGLRVTRAINAVSLRNVLSAGNAGRNINIAP